MARRPKPFTIHQPPGRPMSAWTYAKSHGLSRKEYLDIVRYVAGSAAAARLVKWHIDFEIKSRVNRKKRDGA